MKMKTIIFTAIFLSCQAMAQPVSDKERETAKALIKDAAPYVVGMGKSINEVCQDMATDMVNKYGNQLSGLGKPPSEIRSSTYGLCLDAAMSANSLKEVDMWKKSAMQIVNQEFRGTSENYPARKFLVESINLSAKMAKPIAFFMEATKAQKN